MTTYYHKPKTIRGAKDLIKFIKGIPAKFWCVDERDNGRGQHCVLGHLDNAYGYNKGRDGFTEMTLAAVNNGTGTNDAGYVPRYYTAPIVRPLGGITGRSIKSRLVKFLEGKLK